MVGTPIIRPLLSEARPPEFPPEIVASVLIQARSPICSSDENPETVPLVNVIVFRQWQGNQRY